MAHLDRLRPYPVPAVAASARGARARRGTLAGGHAVSPGVLGRVQDCHFVHRGSFDHAEPRGAGGDFAALASGGIGDCDLGGARRPCTRGKTLFSAASTTEVGQLAIVSAFLPIAYALRASWFNRRLVFAGGSIAIAAIAGIWLVERAFNMKIISP